MLDDQGKGWTSHLPFGLLQPGRQLCVLPFEGGAALLQPLPLLQELCVVLLQLLLLLLELEGLQLQQLLRPLGFLRCLLHLGGTALSQFLHLQLATLLLLFINLPSGTNGVESNWPRATMPGASGASSGWIDTLFEQSVYLYQGCADQFSIRLPLQEVPQGSALGPTRFKCLIIIN